MPSDKFEKFLKQKIEEAQSVSSSSNSWDKEEAWLRIQNIALSEPEPAKENKKYVWYYYAAAVIIITMLTAWPIQKLFIVKEVGKTQLVAKSIEKPSLVKSKNNQIEIIKTETALKEPLVSYKIPVVNKLPKAEAKGKTGNFNKNNQNEIASTPKLAEYNQTAISNDKQESVEEPMAATAIPVSPPIKVKIVLGATTINKIQTLAAETDVTVKKTKSRILKKGLDKESDKNKQNLTAINREKNPLSVNTKIKF